MRAAPKAVDGAATAATLTSRRRRTRRFTGRDPLRVGNHENVQTLCDDAVRKRMATGSDAQRPRRMTSSVSAGHFRRARGLSPHVLRVGRMTSSLSTGQTGRNNGLGDFGLARKALAEPGGELGRGQRLRQEVALCRVATELGEAVSNPP